MVERIIHIEWDGPYSLDQLDSLKDLRKDHGLYQIYGHHPIYGSNVLLYIGQTYGRTFGERIEEHNFGRRLARGPRTHRSLCRSPEGCCEDAIIRRLA
jgi:hypothetical protein